MKSAALVTDCNHPHLTDDDRLLVPVLHEMGVEASAVQWDSKSTDWESFDACVIRSCWDYHLRINEFLQWLRHLESHRVSIWNPIETVRWNHHKRYLKDLERRGVPIVPTYLVGEQSDVALRDIVGALRMG